MAVRSTRSIVRALAGASVLLGLTATAAASDDLCPEDHREPRFDADDAALHRSCADLWPEVRSPSKYLDGTDKPLNVYEGQIGAFLNDLCYRDPRLADTYGQGWAVDKHVRDTGPYVAHRNEDNDWVGEYHGFHSPVLIWYSPEMIDWLRTYRPGGATATAAEAPPVPFPTARSSSRRCTPLPPVAAERSTSRT